MALGRKKQKPSTLQVMGSSIRHAVKPAQTIVAIPVCLATFGVMAALVPIRHRLRARRMAHDVTTLAANTNQWWNIVWVGDSTTVGKGASDARYTVPQRIAQNLNAPNRTRVLGYTGARVKDVVKKQLPKLPKLEPNLVVVSVGANDVVMLTSQRRFRKWYKRLLERLPRESSVVVIGVPDMGLARRFPPPFRSLAANRSARLNQVVRELSEERELVFANLFDADTDIREDPHRYFASDGFHPSDAGHELLANLILPSFEKATSEQPSKSEASA